MKQYIPWRVKVFIFRAELWFKTLIASRVNSICPICGHNRAKIFRYGPDKTIIGPSICYPEISIGHVKYRCVKCSNIYATWLQRDTAEVGKIYSGCENGSAEVHAENDRKEVQKQMIRICAEYVRKEHRITHLKILDFGCGPNFKAAIEMNHEDSGLTCTCCDINPLLPYDGKTFFCYTGAVARELEGIYDGITSVDVFEHLNYPIDDMLKFNKFLKTGGYMVHYTPLQWYLRLQPGHYDTPLHTNFPSKKSLQVLCRKTGFKLIGDCVPFYGYWYLIFKKIAGV